MTFTSPIPFQAALDILRRKKAMPTDLPSAALQTLDREVRASSLFSARTTCAEYLEEVRVVSQRLLNGEINEATARKQLQDWLKSIGYSPETHFGSAADKEIPPALPGSLQDLASSKRIKLVTYMQTALAQNTGFMTKCLTPVALHAYPAWELVREEWRKHPRGTTDKDTDTGWPERWIRAGGKLVGGRMIALCTDAIWQELGDSGIFDDGTDSDAPPYAFNSGMGLRRVPRKECLALGLDPDGNVDSTTKRPSLLAFLEGVPKATVPLADMKADRAALLQAAAALRRAA